MASSSGGGGEYKHLKSAPVRRLRHPLDESPVWSLLASTLSALLALLVGLPVLLVLALLLPLTLTARWLLLLLYWNRHRPLISAESGGGAESMRGNDCRWLGAAWRCSVLHAVLVFDGRMDLSTLQQLLLTRVLPAYPRLTHRLHKLPLTAGAGHCWLPDPHFDIDKHVFHGPSFATQLQLQTYVSQLLNEGLLTDKPPWELQVLQSGGVSGATAILRVHQSVADGPALVALLCRSLADTKVLPYSQLRREQSVGLYCKFLHSCVFGPLTVFLWLLLSARDYNVLTQRISWSGHMRVSWSSSITLSKVTRVKQVTRSTVNCVLLSALAGALRSLFQSCGVRQPPDLRVVLPVDLRKTTDSRLGSQVAPVVVSLPVGVEGAVPRLWSTRRALRTLRQSSDALVVYLATAAFMTLLPAQSARSILSAFTEQKASLQFSSMVGPSAAVLVGGCPLKSVYSLLPAQSGLSLAVSVLTYADQVFVAVAADSSLEPAGTIILTHLQAQVELMYSLLKNRRVPGESKSESILYRFPDVTRSPVRELASRLSLVQGEVERLSSSRSDSAVTHDSERLQRLRAEFSHLLRELRKRKSLTESDEFEGQWRSRRRAVSCSFTRRPSMSVGGLPYTTHNRPASLIEPPVSSTLAFPSTSTSVFNVNYLSNTSTPSYDNLSPDHSLDAKLLAENNNRMSQGLYDEIISALESSETISVLAQTPSSQDSYCLYSSQVQSNNVDLRDHISSSFAHAEISFKNRSNLRKYKSRTMNSIYEKAHRRKRNDLVDSSERRVRISRSCNILNSYYASSEYDVAIESLSEFATKIRKLSLENSLAHRSSKSNGCSRETDSLFRQKKLLGKSSRHSSIPHRKSLIPKVGEDLSSTQNPPSNPSPPRQPCIYEFV